jgi:hypothetical protein
MTLYVKQLIFPRLKRFIYKRLRTVPISAVKCENRKVAIEEGWGRQSIDHFPPCGFYKLFFDGFEEEAIAKMKEWYYHRLIEMRLCDVEKLDGGMYNGSLFKLIVSLHQANGLNLKQDLRNADRSIIRQAITTRVEERFKLLKSIRSHGYSCAWDYISTKVDKNQYILIDGHHRVAALQTCGYSSVMINVSESLTLRIAIKFGKLLRKWSFEQDLSIMI